MTVFKEFLIETNIRKTRLDPIIKWAGGKEKELKYIYPFIPNFKNYYEPFVGGGAVYFSLEADRFFINDKSSELIDLYIVLKEQDKLFFDFINLLMKKWEILSFIVRKNYDEIVKNYKNFSNEKVDIENIKEWFFDFVDKNKEDFLEVEDLRLKIEDGVFLNELNKNVLNKLNRMKMIEKEKGNLIEDDIVSNFETALKSSFYMYIRYIYNNSYRYDLDNSIKTSLFYFIRNYAYSGMFRYNKRGNFNVPYGGIGYNSKNLCKKLKKFKEEEFVKHLNKTNIENLDFEDFLKKYNPSKDDFIFLDPPYDSEFSTYTKNSFTKKDQIRLANYLINSIKAKWLMIIKNTDFIYELYSNRPNIKIDSFKKRYLVSFKNRNDKNAEHLIVRNY